MMLAWRPSTFCNCPLFNPTRYSDRVCAVETIPKRGYRFVVPIAQRPAVAVMPFVNQTADAKDDYFSDGLNDELIRVLSRIDGLRVTARSVTFRFKGQPSDARQVGRELGVEAVFEGSVWRSGDRIREAYWSLLESVCQEQGAGLTHLYKDWG
jgi:hypothetical protein